MLGDGRLGDAELPADDRRDLPGRLLLVDEQLEHPPADRADEDIESVHRWRTYQLSRIYVKAYIRHRGRCELEIRRRPFLDVQDGGSDSASDTPRRRRS